jgi:hypothetical protein
MIMMCGFSLTTGILAADQTAPSAALLEFLAESSHDGKEWLDPLTIKEMDDAGAPVATSGTTPSAPPAGGKQP